MAHRREHRLIAVIRAECRPVVIGAVENILVFVVLQGRDHVNVLRAAVFVAVVDHGLFARSGRVFRQKPAVDLRVAGHEREIDRHGRLLGESLHRGDVRLKLGLIGRVVLFEQRAAGAEIDVLVLLFAAGELAAGLECRPRVAQRELIGDIGIDLACVFAAEKALGAKAGELLQLAVFAFGKAPVRQRDQQRQSQNEKAAKKRDLNFKG